MKAKMKGNGLGTNKVKSWSPTSVRNGKDVTHSGQGKVEPHTRKGAGQK